MTPAQKWLFWAVIPVAIAVLLIAAVHGVAYVFRLRIVYRSLGDMLTTFGNWYLDRVPDPRGTDFKP